MLTTYICFNEILCRISLCNEADDAITLKLNSPNFKFRDIAFYYGFKLQAVGFTHSSDHDKYDDA